LLVLGFIANLLIVPVARKWFMKEEDPATPVSGQAAARPAA